jgi:hypothetical protein
MGLSLSLRVGLRLRLGSSLDLCLRLSLSLRLRLSLLPLRLYRRLLRLQDLQLLRRDLDLASGGRPHAVGSGGARGRAIDGCGAAIDRRSGRDGVEDVLLADGRLAGRDDGDGLAVRPNALCDGGSTGRSTRCRGPHGAGVEQCLLLLLAQRLGLLLPLLLLQEPPLLVLLVDPQVALVLCLDELEGRRGLSRRVDDRRMRLVHRDLLGLLVFH